MDNPTQKDIWRQDKEQMRRDKLNQPREIKRRAVPFTLGSKKNKINVESPKDFLADDLLRKRLGL